MNLVSIPWILFPSPAKNGSSFRRVEPHLGSWAMLTHLIYRSTYHSQSISSYVDPEKNITCLQLILRNCFLFNREVTKVYVDEQTSIV